jgi:cation diffusion facilitator CzcD-associated flavoprotein CzcO
MNCSSPCYEGLKNNVPTPLLEMTINSWKPGTEDIVEHDVLKQYIQDTVTKHDVESFTAYNTRVEQVVQEADGWQVQTSTLDVTASGKTKKVTKVWVRCELMF